MGAILRVYDNGQTWTVNLDEYDCWEIGRATSPSQACIMLTSIYASRHHGIFKNLDGFWFYLDQNAKNGTIYNGKCLEPGIRGRIKPVMLETGDSLVFGARGVSNPGTGFSRAVIEYT